MALKNYPTMEAPVPSAAPQSAFVQRVSRALGLNCWVSHHDKLIISLPSRANGQAWRQEEIHAITDRMNNALPPALERLFIDCKKNISAVRISCKEPGALNETERQELLTFLSRDNIKSLLYGGFIPPEARGWAQQRPSTRKSPPSSEARPRSR